MSLTAVMTCSLTTALLPLAGQGPGAKTTLPISYIPCMNVALVGRGLGWGAEQTPKGLQSGVVPEEGT